MDDIVLAGLFLFSSVLGAILGGFAGYAVVTMRLDTLMVEWKQAKQAYLTDISRKGVEARQMKKQAKDELKRDFILLMGKGNITGEELKGLLAKHADVIGGLLEGEGI